tara:strand:+ start:1686 stop:2228 length:543 start_codon:yes stop_codon:yes gene_type:complete
MLHHKPKQQTPLLGCYRINNDEIELPSYATEKSACFDIHADLSREICIQSYYKGKKEELKIKPNQSYYLRPQERALIPTGLVFHMPEGYSLRLHPRSGLAWKHGVTLLNAEGVIDEDYYNETFALMYNAGHINFTINHNDRICQGEIVKTTKTGIELINSEPKQTTDREGGFGSTGVNNE